MVPSRSTAKGCSVVLLSLILSVVAAAQSIATLKQQAANGDAYAQTNLGELYADGKGVPQDYSQAAVWWRKAAEQGNADAQFGLGWLYENGYGVLQDYSQAAAWYRKAAEAGDAGAQANLAALYEHGYGVRQDYAQAANWYRKAAEQGNVGAQATFGDLYFNGKGVPRDYAQAANWYRKAAEQGDTGAQNSLGLLYDDGRGVPQDYAQAATWYRKAAERGNRTAEYNLGRAYYKGQGIRQDYVQAAGWLLKAAEQGDADAQFDMGLAYSIGRGVPENYSEAYFWLNLAAVEGKESNQEKALKTRQEIAALLSRDDLSKAQQRAVKWFEEHPAQNDADAQESLLSPHDAGSDVSQDHSGAGSSDSHGGAPASAGGRLPQNLEVKIVDRKDNETEYTYVVPEQFSSRSNSYANCYGENYVSCSGSTTTHGTITPAHDVSYNVRGATLTLLLPDGRAAVVNCESKFAERFAGPAGNHRNCRIPLVRDIQASFHGDKAKLEWVVSVDGKKVQSETYKVLAVFDKLRNDQK